MEGIGEEKGGGGGGGASVIEVLIWLVCEF